MLASALIAFEAAQSRLGSVRKKGSQYCRTAMRQNVESVSGGRDNGRDDVVVGGGGM